MSKSTIVITGAAKSGIGEAVTRSFLERGFSVSGTYDSDSSEVATSLTNSFPGQISLTQVNHGSQHEVDAWARGVVGPIGAIVHCHFLFEMEDPHQFNIDLWNRLIFENLTCPNLITHQLADRLANGGSVVFVTSTEGFIGSFGASAYACSKAAIHNLTKTIANTLGSRSIRVNSVAAGWIGGVMDTDEVFEMSRKITPLARLGDPAEVANVVAFLVSPEASFVNGSVIVADGGYTGVDTIAKFEFQHSQGGS